MYSGPAASVLPYFAEQGHTCPEHFNPAGAPWCCGAAAAAPRQQPTLDSLAACGLPACAALRRLPPPAHTSHTLRLPCPALAACMQSGWPTWLP